MYIAGTSSSDPCHPSSYKALVSRIQAGDSEGFQALYEMVYACAHAYLRRRVDFALAEDVLANTYIAVVEAIQKKRLRQPLFLRTYIGTVVRRQLAASVRLRNRELPDLPEHLSDSRPGAEALLIRQQNVQLAAAILNALSTRDREILRRYYLQNQSKECICREMNLTENQFRLLKSRAKARLADKVQRIMAPLTPGNSGPN